MVPRFGKKGRMLPIRECRIGLLWEVLASPQDLPKGTKASAPERYRGWMATVHNTHVKEPGKMVMELVPREREAELHGFCSV